MNARTHFTCTVAGCGNPHDAKGLCRSHYSRLRRTGNPCSPAARASDGAGWIQRGYKYFTVNGKNTREHILIAERALGRALPAGAAVHHADGDRLNNANSNLVICPSNKYHKLLHVRMDALAASGNANWRKCPFCHQYDDPASMRAEKSGRFVHRECSAKARNAAYAKRKAK